jgi:hypothetical protein
MSGHLLTSLSHKDLVVVFHQLLIIQCKMKHPHDLMI